MGLQRVGHDWVTFTWYEHTMVRVYYFYYIIEFDIFCSEFSLCIHEGNGFIFLTQKEKLYDYM